MNSPRGQLLTFIYLTQSHILFQSVAEARRPSHTIWWQCCKQSTCTCGLVNIHLHLSICLLCIEILRVCEIHWYIIWPITNVEFQSVPLSAGANANQVSTWLKSNRFSNYVSTFSSFSGMKLKVSFVSKSRTSDSYILLLL